MFTGHVGQYRAGRQETRWHTTWSCQKYLSWWRYEVLARFPQKCCVLTVMSWSLNSKTIKEPRNQVLLTSQGRRDAEVSVAAHGFIYRTDSTNGVSGGWLSWSQWGLFSHTSITYPRTTHESV
jgi:hypothetical protein